MYKLLFAFFFIFSSCSESSKDTDVNSEDLSSPRDRDLGKNKFDVDPQQDMGLSQSDLSELKDDGVQKDGETKMDAISNSNLCPSPLPSNWIFCDDFENGDPSPSNYFEIGNGGGTFKRTKDQSYSGEFAMEVFFDKGKVEAGNLKVAFGDGPVGTNAQHRSGERFQEIYWRMRVFHQAGWIGNPAKLSRATMFVGSDWSQGMIAHIWNGSGDFLKGDPVRCVQGSNPVCKGYNDFDNMKWLGGLGGKTPVFSPDQTGRWICVGAHVRLNTLGKKDGVFEFWIDGQLENRREDFDWRGSYEGQGLNAVMFENFWNSGSPQPQYRWFDDLAIAEVKIGCGPS